MRKAAPSLSATFLNIAKKCSTTLKNTTYCSIQSTCICCRQDVHHLCSASMTCPAFRIHRQGWPVSGAGRECVPNRALPDDRHIWRITDLLLVLLVVSLVLRIMVSSGETLERAGSGGYWRQRHWPPGRSGSTGLILNRIRVMEPLSLPHSLQPPALVSFRNSGGLSPLPHQPSNS